MSSATPLPSRETDETRRAQDAFARTSVAAFFSDEQVHAALVVENGRLLDAVERSDLAPLGSGETAATCVG